MCFLREESEARSRELFLLYGNSENICIVFSTPLNLMYMCFNIWNEIVIEVEVTSWTTYSLAYIGVWISK